MANITGAWDIVTASPIGKQKLTLDFVVTGSAVSGTATNDNEHVGLKDGELVGDTATFIVNLKKPLPLAIAYTLRFDGDAVAGTAKAGFFPVSAVVGTRAPSTPAG